MLGGDAFRVKLHAVHTQFPVADPLNDPVSTGRRDLKAIGNLSGINGQGMIAGRLEGIGHTGKHACSGVRYFADLAVHGFRRTHDLAAEHLTNALIAEAHTKQRNAPGGFLDQLQTNPRRIGVARAGGYDDAVRRQSDHLIGTERIVAVHDNLHAQLADVVEQVVGEAVVVIY